MKYLIPADTNEFKIMSDNWYGPHISYMKNLYDNIGAANAESIDGTLPKNGKCQTFDSYILKLRKWWQQLFVHIVKPNKSQ